MPALQRLTAGQTCLFTMLRQQEACASLAGWVTIRLEGKGRLFEQPFTTRDALWDTAGMESAASLTSIVRNLSKCLCGQAILCD
jgi:hypothetical protein